VLAFRAKLRAMPLKLAPQLINVSDPAVIAASASRRDRRRAHRARNRRGGHGGSEGAAARRRKSVRPPPDLTVSQWADEKRRLSSESSAEPGLWRTDRAPYQRGIMDAITDPRVREIWVMKSAQVGWTEILNNVIGYHVDQDPAPILLVQPTLEMAEAWSKDRFAPMARDTPCLRSSSRIRSRATAATRCCTRNSGGHLTVAGSNSPASLASRPIRIVLFDEVDRFPASAGTEGDPISLGKKRAANILESKVLAGSTPTSRARLESRPASNRRISGSTSSRARTARRMQRLVWPQVRWPEGRPHRGEVLLQGLRRRIDDAQKARCCATASGERRSHSTA
jgi:phage terminase large subunit GpA-like protein